MWPAIISGVASLFGGSRRNRAARQEAERNRNFQERMSSTAHQREVTDLRKAGLNPILSATGGSGASSPSGSVAQFQDVMTPAASSAMAARRLQQEVRNMRATERVAITQAALNQSGERVNTARAALTNTQDRALSGPAAVGGWLGALGETWSAKGPGVVSDVRAWITEKLRALTRMPGSAADALSRRESLESLQRRIEAPARRKPLRININPSLRRQRSR